MNSAFANDRVEELWATAENFLRSNSLAAAAEAASLLAQMLKDEPSGRISTFSNPIHGEVLVLMALIAYLSNDLARSDKLLDDALSELRRSPDTSRVPLGKALIAHASSLMDRGRKAEALAALSEAILLLPAAIVNHEDGALELVHALAEKSASITEWKIAESALVAGIEATKKSGRPLTELVSYYRSLATARTNDSRPVEALEPARESLRLAREVVLPPKDIASAILHLATVHLKLNQYEDVRTLANEAIALAPSDSEILYHARSLKGLALWTDVPQEAINVLTEAAEIATRTWGAKSNETVKARAQLANLLSDLYRYREALPHWHFVKNSREHQFGSDSLEYADALSSYAVAVDKVGQYARGDRLYRKALAIFERHLGQGHHDVLTLRYNIAELARVGGAFQRSALEFRDLEKIWRGTGKTETKGFVRVLQNFGLTLTSLQEFSEAREKLEEARRILAKRAGIDSPLYARVLLAIAQLENASDNYATAIPLFERAAAIFRGREDSIDKLEEVEFGAACAKIHVERSDAAIQRAREQLANAIERHGANEQVIVARSHLLAVALLRIQRIKEARETLEHVDTGARLALIEALLLEGEANLRNAVQPMRDFQTLHLSLLFAEATRDEAAVEQAYEMLISLRGAETTILRMRGRSGLQSSSSELQRQVQQLKKAITGLELRGNPEGGAAQAAADLQAYHKQLQRVESKLLEGVNGFRLDFDFIPHALKTIAQGLSSDTALLEFATYRSIDAQLKNPLTGPEQYAAFVVRGGTERVQLFELGPASEIDRLIHEFREGVINQPRREVKPGEVVSWKAPGCALARLLLTEPMREAIAGVQKLLVVPEGKIGLIPLGALPTASGFLLHDFEITYRFASREVRRFKFEENLGVGKAAAVVGAPDYNLQTGAMRSDSIDDEDFLSQFRSGQRFEDLKEAEAECRVIAGLLGIEPLLAKDATKTAVMALDSPEVLHISTHGFVLEHIVPSTLDRQKAAASRALLKDPMERSGLAFAGANAFLDGAELPADLEDGILYASEVSGINLMRTDLVTLSACQTGLGDVLSGDGVHGLQRAFTTAGARTVVCSLWEVPDKPTRTLFTRFYEEIFVNKRPRGEALQDVIRELAREYPLNPVAWGGFVLYGDVDVLTRHDPIRSLNLDTLNSALQVHLARDAVRARAIYERAAVLRQSGAFDSALEAYDTLDKMPNLPERFRVSVELYRGLTYLLAGKLEKAIEVYSAGLRFTGLDLATRASVLVNRGLAHWELKHNEEAIMDLNTVIDTPGMPRDQRIKAILGKAEIYLGLARYDDAESETNKVDSFELTPNEAASATLLLGQAWAAQGRIEDAIANFQKILTQEKVDDRYRQIASTLLAQFTPK